MFATSRYQFSVGATDAEGRTYLSTPEPFRYVKLPDNLVHVVTTGDTLWALAGRYYAAEPRGHGYWWVIADFQPEPVYHDPTVALPEGSVVVVPSLLTLRSRVLNAARRRATP